MAGFDDLSALVDAVSRSVLSTMTGPEGPARLRPERVRDADLRSDALFDLLGEGDDSGSLPPEATLLAESARRMVSDIAAMIDVEHQPTMSDREGLAWVAQDASFAALSESCKWMLYVGLAIGLQAGESSVSDAVDPVAIASAVSAASDIIDLQGAVHAMQT